MSSNRREFLQGVALMLAALARRPALAVATGRQRARALGIRIGQMQPGPWNAITDVPGVRVGHTTLIRGSGPLVVGQGPVRTGVTAIWPSPDILDNYLPCGFDVPNGNGEMTGLQQVARLGILGTPICLTNTSSVGMVYDALDTVCSSAEWPPVEPVVGETWDAWLNDIEGRHVHAVDVEAALDRATSGPVAEGCVGGGTGMICYGFKGGIGTASRILPAPLEGHTVGVLVQANHGRRKQLRIDGVPVGALIEDFEPDPEYVRLFNSILMIVATDVPLLDYQLERVARRAVHGLAATGSTSNNSSGDFTLAFSTTNPIARRTFWGAERYTLAMQDQFDLEPILIATAEATEEAIVNALFMATDMVGRDDHKVFALPIDRTLSIMERHLRLFQEDDLEDPDHA